MTSDNYGFVMFARAFGFEIEQMSPMPKHEIEELFEEEIGMKFYDEVVFKDGTIMPYPHYAFPSALPTKIKGISV